MMEIGQFLYAFEGIQKLGGTPKNSPRNICASHGRSTAVEKHWIRHFLNHEQPLVYKWYELTFKK